MTRSISRRDFSKILLAGLFGGLSVNSGDISAASSRHVVVIGGGFGGATAAKYLRKLDRSIRVTIVEPRGTYYTCPCSNCVLVGMMSMRDIAVDYGHLSDFHGVNVIIDRVVSIDALKGTVTLSQGKSIGYDRLILSPGIGFKWKSIPGYDASIADTYMPHGYVAGSQTELLLRQLQTLRNGDNVVICSPSGQARCPVAPYERASLIANYLKHYKPDSRVLILDEKDWFPKQDLFMRAWDRFYPGLIEWRAGSAGGHVVAVDARSMTAMTDFGEEKGGVVNVIPPQQAGRIAFEAGLSDDTGWCPVDPVTFESRFFPGIHVIGDACNAGAMPKSAFAASSQGKVVAAAIVRLFRGLVPVEPSLVSTCYSLVRPGYGISEAGVYRLSASGIVAVKGAGGMTPMDGGDDLYRQEAVYAEGWYRNVLHDVWG